MALLHVNGLTKRFGKRPVVDGLSFDIAEGRCVALLGPNGAGKTTTLKMLCGLLTPSDGSVRFAGTADGVDIRRSIGYLPQYPAFFGWMTALEYLRFVGELAGLSAKESGESAKTMLRLVGLEDARSRRTGGFSGGMKQRLGLAQAMIHKPKLIVLDEPVSALDPLGRREVLELMREMKRDATILFSTHVLHDAEEISDDILIIRSGQIVVKGDLASVRRDNEQPVIRIELDAEAEMWFRSLADRSYVRELRQHSPYAATLVVTDLDDARKKLLHELSAAGLPVSRFEVGGTSLEDLFMKVVQA